MSLPYRELFVSAQDGRRLYVRDYHGPRHGAATPVLCLGGLTRNCRDFELVADRLAADRRVVCPDYRGRGRSEWDRDWRRYAPLPLLADLSDLVTALDLAPVVIVGTSLGGVLGMGFAVLRPTALAAIVLNDVGPELDTSELDRFRGYAMRDHPHADWSGAVADLKRMFPDLRPPTADGWQRMAEATWRRGTDGLLHYDFDPALARTMGDPAALPDLWPLFRALAPVPVATIRGGASRVFKRDTLERMMAARPDMITAEVDGVGHTPHLDEPASRAAIDALLRRVDGKEEGPR